MRCRRLVSRNSNLSSSNNSLRRQRDSNSKVNSNTRMLLRRVSDPSPTLLSPHHTQVGQVLTSNRLNNSFSNSSVTCSVAWPEVAIAQAPINSMRKRSRTRARRLSSSQRLRHTSWTFASSPRSWPDASSSVHHPTSSRLLQGPPSQPASQVICSERRNRQLKDIQTSTLQMTWWMESWRPNRSDCSSPTSLKTKTNEIDPEVALD